MQMKMKTISFKNGMHITVPDEAERGVVFGTSTGDGGGSFALEGPVEVVAALVLELARVALKESPNEVIRLAFAKSMISVLADSLKDEKKDH